MTRSLHRVARNSNMRPCALHDIFLPGWIRSGGRVAVNESLITEISGRGLRKTTKETGLDRKTIRAILIGKKVKAVTLAKVVMGLREELGRPDFQQETGLFFLKQGHALCH